MTVQLPNSEILHSTLLATFPGLEDLYKLVEDTGRLFGTMPMLVPLTSDPCFAELGITVCPFHAAAIEDLAQLAIASMEQRVEEMEGRVEEMKRRMAMMEQHLEELERQLVGTEAR